MSAPDNLLYIKREKGAMKKTKKNKRQKRVSIEPYERPLLKKYNQLSPLFAVQVVSSPSEIPVETSTSTSMT